MKKIAILIGNNDYLDSRNKLTNAVNDANKLSEKLSTLGFKCITITNASNDDMYRNISEISSELDKYEVGLFFFAGHGVQVGGKNYLAGINTSFVDEGSCRYTSIALDYIIDLFEKSELITKIFILDACRDNPFDTKERGVGISTELAPVYAPKGSLIAFATSPGQRASDNGIGGNGAFTSALLSHIGTTGIRIEELFKRVRNTLSALTNNKQISWEHTSLMGDFYFNYKNLDGEFITVYSEDALSDRDYIFTRGNILSDIIIDLKSHDWYMQNPAIEKIGTIDFSSSKKDEIFLLGRNIYQAACGSSIKAIQWITSLSDKLKRYESEVAFHILNGILFEIYFNYKGKLRNKFKSEYFTEVLQIASYPEYSKSCEFIRRHLKQYEQRVVYMPGTDDDIYLDVNVHVTKDDAYYVDSIHMEGRNILYNESGSELYILGDPDDMYLNQLKIQRFEENIRKILAVPKNHLKLNYSSEKNLEYVLVPYDFMLLRYSI